MQHQPYPPPAGAGPYAAPPGGATGGHEFSDADNHVIGRIGSRAWWWGLVCVITGVLGLLMLGSAWMFRGEVIAAGVEPQYVTLFFGTITPIVLTHMVIAFNYMSAGSSLKAVVETQGRDVEHLMQSLHKLGTAFMIEFIVGMVALVGGFAAGIYFAGMDFASSPDSFQFDIDD